MSLPQLTGSETMASHSSYHNEERTQINTNITNIATNASGISTINTKLSDAVQDDFEKLHDITASASEINALVSKIRYAVKTSDQTVNNSETLVDITDLLFSVEANSKYLIDFNLINNSNTTAFIKYGWSYPAGATMKWGAFETSAISDSVVIETYDTEDFAYLEYAFLQTTNAGTMQLKFAQNTADVSDTKVITGSVLVIHKLT